MAKSDVLLARIDADIARLKDIEVYAQTHGDNSALLDIINGDLNELQRMRGYVTKDEIGAAVKARKPRKSRRAAGLPTQEGA